MLEVNRINSFYDKSHVLHDVSLDVHKAEIVGLLGRNGVGKSTTLKSIMGIVRPKAGSIKFNKKRRSACSRTRWQSSASAMFRKTGGYSQLLR
jgi:ABC-type branched-subunit amino acid transport system ATPase component